jgi:hypothetical protein
MSGGVAFLTSCSNDKSEDEPSVTTDEKETAQGNKGELTLTINVGASRAGVADYDSSTLLSEGTREEGYIDPEKLFLFVSTDPSVSNFGNTPQTLLTVTSVVRLNDYTYRVKASFTSLPDKFLLTATANWPYTLEERKSKSYTINNIAHLCVTQGAEFPYHYGGSGTAIVNMTQTNRQQYGDYDYTVDGEKTCYTPSTTTPMPMFGTRYYDLSSLTNKTQIVLNDQPLSLIRSMAKLVVQSSNYDIEGVTLKYSYNVGMCGFATKDALYTVGTHSSAYTLDPTEADFLNITAWWTSAYTKGFNDENPVQITEDLPFKKLTDRQYVIYIPSYNNCTFSNLTTYTNYMTVRIKGADYRIDFTDASGNAYNLARNFMYLYDIEKVNYDSSIQYYVTPFTDYISAPITFE